MPEQPYTIERFGGFNPAADPLELGSAGAVDLLDVDLDKPGRVRCRDGYAKFTATTKAGILTSLASAVYGTGAPLLAWGGGTYYALDSTGAVASSSAPASSSVAPQWSPGQFTYATYDGAVGRIIQWNGGIWTTVNISGSVAFPDTWSVIGSTPYSDRLALAGGSTFADRVVFSDPGVGGWTAVNWIDIPNDSGSPTTAAVTYRDAMIVFKTDKFAVFGTEGVGSTGAAVFNFRMVDTGVGLVGRFGTALSPDGVYFVGRDGIYVTSGGAPTKVSGALDAMFRGDAAATALGLDISQTYLAQAAAAYYRERLYIAVTTGASTTNNRLLVYNPKDGAWTVWSIPAASLCTHRTSAIASEELFFGYATASNDVGRHFRTYTTDAGAAIAWSYKTGRYALSTPPGQSVVVPESSLVGSGTVTLRLDSDAYTNQAASAVLGTAPAVAEGWPQSVDQEGRWLQATLSGSGPAVVSELRHYISSVKSAGLA